MQLMIIHVIRRTDSDEHEICLLCGTHPAMWLRLSGHHLLEGITKCPLLSYIAITFNAVALVHACWPAQPW